MSDFINTIDVLGDDAVIDSIIDRSITEFKDSTINSQINKVNTFAHCTQLTTVHLPNATFYASTAAGYNFRGCSALTDVDISSARVLGVGMFNGCSALEKIVLPSVTQIHNSAFASCTNLRMIDFHQALKGIGNCVTSCTSLSAFILRSTTFTPMTVANVFSINFTCPISSGTGYIYVPSALVAEYQAATNWSTYADQFRALEDWTVDGTITGEMREHCQSLALNATELTFTDANTQTLTATGVFGIYDAIIWTSNDNLVVGVNDGVVTPVSDGTAIITATCGNHSATCTVTVNAGLELPDNILYDISFNTGYLNQNGTVGGVTSTNDTYTDKFDISAYINKIIEVRLIDVGSKSTHNRICYYDANNTSVGYTEGAMANYGVVITSTVPETAVYAAISVNRTSGFSGIDIYYDDVLIGAVEYTS